MARQSEHEAEIISRHAAQSLADHARLTSNHVAPVFGQVSPWELVEMLGQCVDPTDRMLGAASQLTHLLQVLDAMDADGVDDDELRLLAVVHDFGKLLLLTDEDPANVVCMNAVLEVGDPTDPSTVVTQWNHDELAHMRLAPLLSDESAVLLRLHSVMPAVLARALDGRACEAFLRRHQQFFTHDQGSKSPVLRSTTRLAEVRSLVERRLPSVIVF